MLLWLKFLLAIEAEYILCFMDMQYEYQPK